MTARDMRFTTAVIAPLSKPYPIQREGCSDGKLTDARMFPPLYCRKRRRRASTLLHRRRRSARDIPAPPVAALERISITEPQMAGSSSIRGSEGPSF